ncbi:hypothetical protein GGR57DRAFT_3138 [Xylariaceae sp. FL1272]|nr:hypothetical protein GGR57DRAFT_3138 [Xylariaceae sp. FL1272]
MQRPDGDMSLFFLLSNGVYFFDSPMADDWYRATRFVRHVTRSGNLNQTKNTYMPAEGASPLACVEQHQWCNNAWGCGPLASLFGAAYGVAALFNLTRGSLDPMRPVSEDAVGTRLIWPMLMILSSEIGIGRVVGVLGAKSLESQNGLCPIISGKQT